MKTAITSSGNSMNSNLDHRFGRCNYFVIFDSDTQGVEFIPNPNKDAEDGAGPASVQLLASRNVEKIVSGEFGLKIKELLDSLKIQMIIIKEPDKKLNEIIALLKQHL